MTKGAKKEDTGGSRCQNPACGKRFKPIGRQSFCSAKCRAAAFYWKYKEEHGERYAARYERKRKRARRAAATGRAKARTAARR
jgi:hypothetical protein